METTGYFDKSLHPRVKLTVKGLQKSLTINPVIDTGFDGDLSLPADTAIQLGLVLFGKSLVELADGSKKYELNFRGLAVWQGQERFVKIFTSDSEDALIGSDLLKDQKLTIGYATRSVTIEPDVTPDSNRPKKRKSVK